MEEEINIEKLKSIFATATGDRVIEVTEDEYQALYDEAVAKKIPMTKNDDNFVLKLGHVNVTITCDYDDEDEDYFDDEDELE